MTHLLNADLHCHSVVSDGTLSPEALAARAKANGVALWALTDHDETAGLERAMAAARQENLPFLTGTEISVSFAGATVHILGLGFDPSHTALLQGLRATRGGREQRAQQMSDELARAGIPGAFEGAMKFVGNPELISRSHFARYIVEAGFCPDTHSVFRKYLAEGKPGYVPHQWAALRDAVRWIIEAGGVAVIAHPGRYPLSATAEFALFSEFKALGGQGVEVITSAHRPAEFVKYAGYCHEFGLVASRGSDFHSPTESHIDLGRLPDLPGSVTPVWSLLESRVH